MPGLGPLRKHGDGCFLNQTTVFLLVASQKSGTFISHGLMLDLL